jgi:hypothetical protein
MSPLETALAEMEAEARWLEVAAKKAAKDGMYDTGSGFRNRAGGVRRAMEILEKLQSKQPQPQAQES